jgi:hypothetical protein
MQRLASVLLRTKSTAKCVGPPITPVLDLVTERPPHSSLHNLAHKPAPHLLKTLHCVAHQTNRSPCDAATFSAYYS